MILITVQLEWSDLVHARGPRKPVFTRARARERDSTKNKMIMLYYDPNNARRVSCRILCRRPSARGAFEIFHVPIQKKKTNRVSENTSEFFRPTSASLFVLGTNVLRGHGKTDGGESRLSGPTHNPIYVRRRHWQSIKPSRRIRRGTTTQDVGT